MHCVSTSVLLGSWRMFGTTARASRAAVPCSHGLHVCTSHTLCLVACRTLQAVAMSGGMQVVPMLKHFAAEAYPCGGAEILQDSAPQHSAAAAMLRPLPVVQRPTQSPDLNPIEYVWMQMGDMLDGLQLQTGGCCERAEALLKVVVQAAWQQVRDITICDVIHALPAAMKAVHAQPRKLHETRHPMS